MQNFLCFFILSAFLFSVNSKYFFNSWCCILDYFILNCKLWDKFLFELIFEFMALKKAPICGRNVCLSFFFCVFWYLIVIILIEENRKNLTLLSKSESVKFSLIEPVFCLITDSSVQNYFSLIESMQKYFPPLNQLIVTEVISAIWLIDSDLFLAIWTS